MSWILGIDTTASELGVALFRNNVPHVSCSRYVRNSHAEQIADTVTFLLKSSGVPGIDITRAGVATGPGSFTGLRIGLSFLKGFLLPNDALVMPISSLESAARAFCHGPAGTGTITVAFDARQGHVFSAAFAARQGTLTRLTEDTFHDIASFTETLTENMAVLLDTLGNPGSSVFDQLAGRPNVSLAHDADLNRGLACARIASESIAKHDLWRQPMDVLPRYLQQSYAEARSKTPTRS